MCHSLCSFCEGERECPIEVEFEQADATAGSLPFVNPTQLD